MSDGGFVDDKSISDEAELWRRIPPLHFHYDEREGRWRPSSAAFDDDSDEEPMSVVIAAECVGGVDTVLAGHVGYALAAITAGFARERNQCIVRDPQPDQPAHALVVGRKTEATMRAFARKSRWVVPPPNM